MDSGQLKTTGPAPPSGGWRALFKAVFERSANPMMLLTTERMIVVLNPAFTATFGYENDTVVGRRADMFVEGTSTAEVERDWAELNRTGRLTMNRLWHAADGRVVEVQFAAHGTSVEGRPLVLVVVLECDLCPVAKGGGSGVTGPLTPRELEVVSHIAAGEQLPRIANALFISPSTVRTHVRNAMDKLDARTQAQLVAITIAERLIDPESIVRHARRGSR